jgi:NADPH-dependent 2,4-dienoyl-CoA reductase/sulfur reductase-like enzyme
MERPVVIVGASLGGLRTAEGLRRSGFRGGIQIIGDESHMPYNRPPLSKDFLGGVGLHDEIAFARRSTIADVEWILSTPIAHADLGAGRLTAADGQTFEFGDLVIATGLRPRRLDVQGAPLQGCFAVRTIDDAIRLRGALHSAARVVVVGAGFVGCEVAATARKMGCAVTVVGRDSLAMERALGGGLSEELMRRHEHHGVRFVMGRRVVELRGAEHVSGVVLDDGSELACDVLVEAIGSAPNVEWLRGTGLDLTDGVLTDTGMRVLSASGEPWPNVFAVGDVARFPNPRFGEEAATVEHWNIPTETARRASAVIAARHEGVGAEAEILTRPFEPIPSFWSDQFETHILAYGVTVGADHISLLEGDVHGACVYGFFRDGELAGVCGLDDRAAVMRYRDRVRVAAGVRALGMVGS